MANIDSIAAHTVSDSRGMPTVEVVIRSGNIEARAKVPSGKSAGTREACELRDKDGRGVSQAIDNVNMIIAPALRGVPIDPVLVDERLCALDGTENKIKLGANATLGISIAVLRVAAITAGVPLWKYIAEQTHSEPSFPHLYMNMLNGGAHASFRLPFQEYIVVVGGQSVHRTYAEAGKIFETLGKLIRERYGEVPMGDEGGYSPDLRGIEKPFALLEEAMEGELGAFIAIDAAASEFFHDGTYIVEGTPYGASELEWVYEHLVSRFHMKSIEDPFDESDFSAFETITRKMGDNVLIVGDDLTVTNPRIMKEMVAQRRANAMIIKPNQIGTMTEVFEAVRIAREAGWRLIVSHRSGETDDAFIADLTVGIGAYGLKAGAPTQYERRVKYERLLKIEKEFTI